jgi:hypothetical protein
MVAGPAGAYVATFLEQLGMDWVDMRVAVGSEDFGCADERLRDLPEREAWVLVARDQRMVARWEDQGYYIEDGEGPFAILYEPMKGTSVKASVLQDPYDRGGFLFRPYEVTIVSRGVWLVTLVLPDAASDFSLRLIRSFESAVRSGSTAG